MVKPGVMFWNKFQRTGTTSISTQKWHSEEWVTYTAYFYYTIVYSKLKQLLAKYLVITGFQRDIK